MWVIVPDQKVVFVGDLVLKNQPPFLAHSDLPSWLEALEILLSPSYRGYTFISGRGGAVSTSAVKAQNELIQQIHERLEKMGKRGTRPDATEKLIEPFLSRFKSSAARHKQYVQRMRYGLRHYYARHYHLGSGAEE
jgi:glyoxylase-like metal-dependent hydrolase (beta-lactamase superfamily II)